MLILRVVLKPPSLTNSIGLSLSIVKEVVEFTGTQPPYYHTSAVEKDITTRHLFKLKYVFLVILVVDEGGGGVCKHRMKFLHIV